MSTPAPIRSGSSIGPYQIGEKIGAGGMGEVYRATDNRLNRDVAVKILSSSLASDPDRTARFRREAQVLASLNHPGIAHIYGFEESGGAFALAMELVEGQTLEQRIAAGPMPLDGALDIARQLAEALEYAHDRGIVHRDLKPANIKLTPDGSVKVLDFGLAKAIAGGESEAGAAMLNPADSPTITFAGVRTTAGLVLGTAAYMSPEQARGHVVDRRSDIWAFGAILFEMLSGKQAFGGDTVSDIVAAVISRDPDWSLLPPSTPVAVRKLIMRCLNKLVKVRLQAIGEARIAIDDYVGAGDAPPEAVEPPRRTWLWKLLAGVAAAAAIGLGALQFRPAAPQPVIRFKVDPPEGALYMLAPEVSADGQTIAATVRKTMTDISRIALRSLDSSEMRILPGTDGAHHAIFSPNGHYIAFERRNKLTVYELATGNTQEIQDDVAQWQVFSWTADGRIAFGTRKNDGIWSVASSGGSASLTRVSATLDPGGNVSARPVPGGYIYEARATAERNSTVVRAVREGAAGEPQTVVAGSMPRFAPGKQPYLLYIRDSNLYAQRFDTKRMRVAGDAVPIVSGVSEYAVAGNALAYTSSNLPETQLVWATTDGKPAGNVSETPRFYMGARLSPDGTRAVGSITETGTRLARAAIWIEDFRRGALTRLTFGAAEQTFAPIWSPDGSEIIHAVRYTAGGFALKRMRIDGAGQVATLASGDKPIEPESWSRDGRYLMVNKFPQRGLSELWIKRLDGGTEFKVADGDSGAFSTDGKWIAYLSIESGRRELYVRAFDGTPAATGKWQISTEGAGPNFAWAPDGKALYYSGPNSDRLFRVDLKPAGHVFSADRPVAVMDLERGIQPYTLGVSPDGKRLFFGVPVAKPPQYYATTVVLNWRSLLRDHTPQQ